METIYSKSDPIRYNDRKGFHFFDESANRWFNSRTGERVINASDGVYFVTSERFDDNTPRKYTARVMRAGGSIDKAFGSEFQAFGTSRQAWAFIESNLGCDSRTFIIRPLEVE